eukprot:4532159-Pyramimonas_sp.AAC.1
MRRAIFSCSGRTAGPAAAAGAHSRRRGKVSRRPRDCRQNLRRRPVQASARGLARAYPPSPTLERRGRPRGHLAWVR